MSSETLVRISLRNGRSLKVGPHPVECETITSNRTLEMLEVAEAELMPEAGVILVDFHLTEPVMDILTKAKLEMLKACKTMMNKEMWVTWADGNQYFVIKPQDFRELLAPAERVDEAADRQEEGRLARMPKSL